MLAPDDIKDRFIKLCGLLWVLLLVGAVPGALAQESWDKWGVDDRGEEFVPGVVWVRFAQGRVPQIGMSKAGFADFDATAAPFQVTEIRQAFVDLEHMARKRPMTASMEWLRGVYEVAFSASVPPAVVARLLRRSRDVELAEPKPVHKADRVAVSAMEAPDDTYYSSYQDYMDRMDFEEAWAVTKGESGSVIIAAVDIGLKLDHADISPNLWTNADETADNNVDDDGNGYVDDVHGWNFVTNTANPNPANNLETHGTLVTGTANAATDNSVGIAGAAWNAKSMAIHAGCSYNPDYVCYGSEGIVYAYSNGADIINMSYGGSNTSSVEHTAVKSALEAGAVLIASAGNESSNNDDVPSYPASFPEVLAVGATQSSSDRIASFSNYGRSVHIWAPGAGVYTTDADGAYTSASGTSFSSPLVAGVAALVKTKNSSYDPERIREHLRLTSDKIDASNTSGLAGLLGNGRVNAHSALTESEKPGIRLVSTTVTDANGDGAFAPGEQVTISAEFTNYGGRGVECLDRFYNIVFLPHVGNLIGASRGPGAWHQLYRNVHVRDRIQCSAQS